MSLNASKMKRPPRKPKAPALDAGVYPARVVLIASLGLQPQGDWKGKEKPPAYGLLVTYELLDEFMPDEDGNDDKEKPRWFSERLAMHPLDSELATSTKRYFALDSANNFGGDWSKLIETPCNVTLTTKPDPRDESIVYNKVSNVSSMRAKDAERAPGLVNEPLVFDVESPDMEVFDKLPQWIQNIITEDSLDFDGSALDKALRNKPKSGTKNTPQQKADNNTDDDSDEEVDW